MCRAGVPSYEEGLGKCPALLRGGVDGLFGVWNDRNMCRWKGRWGLLCGWPK